MSPAPLYVGLLHDEMLDKTGRLVTTSLTMIDVHDFARSSRTYGVETTFVVHSSPTMRKLGRTLKSHWEEGYGSTYNPRRKAALEIVEFAETLDEAVAKIDSVHGELPTIVATAAKDGGERISYAELRSQMEITSKPIFMLFGTGWGMSPQLIAKTNLFLQPIKGPVPYNHLSVRAAAAISLDRLRGDR